MFRYYSSAVVLCLLMTSVYTQDPEEAETAVPEDPSEDVSNRPTFPIRPSPGEEGSTPGEEGSTPGEEGSTPGEEGSTPGEEGPTPGGEEPTPGGEEVNGTKGFCELHKESIQPVRRMFMIWDTLYFGDVDEFWSLNMADLKNDKTLKPQTRLKYKEIFENSPMFQTDSALFFPQINCKTSEKCTESQKLALHVLEFGELVKPSAYAYHAYKAEKSGDKLESLNQNAVLGWGIRGRDFMTAELWPKNENLHYSGYTFEYIHTTLYISGSIDTNGSKVNYIFARKMDDSGDFGKYQEFEVTRSYGGLMAYDTKLYGLSENKFFLLSVNDSKAEELDQYSIEEFVNCAGISPLWGYERTTTIESLNDTESAETGSDGQPITEETNINTTDDDYNNDNTTKSEATNEKSNLWIIIVIIVIIIIIILIILCLCCCGKKSKPADAEKPKPQATPASKPKGSKAAAKGSKAGKGRKGVLPTKSNESLASTRSIHD